MSHHDCGPQDVRPIKGSDQVRKCLGFCGNKVAYKCEVCYVFLCKQHSEVIQYVVCWRLSYKDEGYNLTLNRDEWADAWDWFVENAQANMGSQFKTHIPLGKNKKSMRWDLQKSPGSKSINALQQNFVYGKTNIIELNVDHNRDKSGLTEFLRVQKIEENYETIVVQNF